MANQLVEMSNFNSTSEDVYVPVSVVARAKNMACRTIRRHLGNFKCSYVFKTTDDKNGKRYEILVSSLEPEIQEKIRLSKPELFSHSDDISGGESLNFLTPVSLNSQTALHNYGNISNNTYPEKAKKLALAKVDLINLWEASRKNKKDKKAADKAFIQSYNNGLISKNLLNVIGEISKRSLYRWYKTFNDAGNNFHSLIPGYKYGKESEYNTSLSEIEQNMLKDLLLKDAKIRVGTAHRLIMYALKSKGYTGQIASYKTYARYVDNFIRNKNDIYTLMRGGQKELSDKVLPYIKRNAKLLNVGDVFIADGNVLDFMVQNPENGRPCRATLIVYVDWKSEDIAGYEIMLTENTQCIASALRNSILRLGKIPKIAYQDNGRAFKSSFFKGDVNLEECCFNGIFSTLGIQPVFATPYNAKAKLVERVFREFTQTFSSLMPSYIGNCIINRPAHLKRNEKFQKSISSDYVPTIQETVNAIEEWLKFYRSQPCVNVKGKTIGEVFNEGRGDGVDPDLLNDLMMVQAIRTVGRNGIRLFSQWYYSEELTGLKDDVVVKYSLTDIFKVKIYSQKSEFICTAEAIEEIHPMAEYLGTAKDVYSYKRALKAKKKIEQKIMQEAYKTVPRLKKNLEWETIKPVAETPKKVTKKSRVMQASLDFVDDSRIAGGNKYRNISL